MIQIDLDEKISREGFNKVLKEDLFKSTDLEPTIGRDTFTPHFFGQSQSTTYRRIQRPDGVRQILISFLIKAQSK